ncbi:hypothetical protein SAY86_005621 [Trapa natans]|uniref:Uncharacterized protein n=1 Tax=Trapa natans TaxID=22666 RepID=A0AAN7L5X4_TRANT|nr:hypothetical protein SAY86_005621 [Trapa natans]
MVSFCNLKDSGGSELLCGVINASPYRNLLGVDDFDALHHSAHSWLASRRMGRVLRPYLFEFPDRQGSGSLTLDLYLMLMSVHTATENVERRLDEE